MVQIKEFQANKANYGSVRNLDKIKYIVIHGTGNDGDSDESNAKYFRNNIVKASANYFVDDDSITQSVLDRNIAYAVGGKKYNNNGGRLYSTVTNLNSVSIELCDVLRNGVVYPSQKTINNAIELTLMLMRKYNIPAHRVIRHYDVNGKMCPSYWVDDNKWKQDFWNKLDNYIPISGQDINPYKEPVKQITSKVNAQKYGLSVFESEGEGVKWLQWELSQVSPVFKEYLYLHGGIDGKCGDATTQLLYLFQNSYGLKPDKICGRNTRAALKHN